MIILELATPNKYALIFEAPIAYEYGLLWEPTLSRRVHGQYPILVEAALEGDALKPRRAFLMESASGQAYDSARELFALPQTAIDRLRAQDDAGEELTLAAADLAGCELLGSFDDSSAILDRWARFGPEKDALAERHMLSQAVNAGASAPIKSL